MNKEQWIKDYVQYILTNEDALAYYNMAVSAKGKEFADRMMYKNAEDAFELHKEVGKKTIERLKDLDTSKGKVKNRPMLDKWLNGILK